MRNTFLGIIGAALLGLAVAACTGSNHTSGAVTAPSAVATTNGVVGATAGSEPKECNNCDFNGTLVNGGASKWTGTTTATSAPTTGHHGKLTLNVAAPGLPGGPVTLSWAGAWNKGSKAHCTISDGNGWSQSVECDETKGPQFGKYVVNPSITTVYTFTDTKNDPPSADAVQFKTWTFTAPTTVNVSAEWLSNMTAGEDDKDVLYKGTLTGSLTNQLDGTLYANATSPTKCGLGGGLPPASHFHVSVTNLTATAFSGSYEAQDCTIDKGTFSLTKQ